LIFMLGLFILFMSELFDTFQLIRKAQVKLRIILLNIEVFANIDLHGNIIKFNSIQIN
jgi:hypothetical protein